MVMAMVWVWVRIRFRARFGEDEGRCLVCCNSETSPENKTSDSVGLSIITVTIVWLK